MKATGYRHTNEANPARQRNRKQVKSDNDEQADRANVTAPQEDKQEKATNKYCAGNKQGGGGEGGIALWSGEHEQVKDVENDQNSQDGQENIMQQGGDSCLFWLRKSGWGEPGEESWPRFCLSLLVHTYPRRSIPFCLRNSAMVISISAFFCCHSVTEARKLSA